MSNEIRLSVGLQIGPGNNAGTLNYQSLPQTFSADATTAIAQGPTPGAVLISAVSGADIDLSKLTNPGGVCRIMNLGTFIVVLGIRDPDSNVFYPIDDFLPGESFIRRLSRYLSQDWAGTGSVISATDKKLHAKAVGGDSYLLVEAFNL